MALNLDRITHPLRLAKGSHEYGSGKACAMNVISYINGDTEITDYPACSARPLAALVQICNDELAAVDGYLSPLDSLLMLDLAWRTVGTADVSETVIHAWMAEALSNPYWGIIRYADGAGRDAINNIASMHRRAAGGEIPSFESWSAAAAAAREAASTATGAANRAAWSAACSTSASSPWLASALWFAATECGTRFEYVGRCAVEFTRNAIDCWRQLAGLDHTPEIDRIAVDSALQKIGTP